MTQDVFKEDMEKAKARMDAARTGTDARGTSLTNDTVNSSLVDGYKQENTATESEGQGTTSEEEAEGSDWSTERLEAERQEREKLTEEKEFAEDILKKQSFVLDTGLKETIEKRTELGQQGLELSREYKAKKLEIESSDKLHDVAKGEALDKLYKTYNDQLEAIIREQYRVNNDYVDKKTETAKKIYERDVELSSRHDFNEKDLSYIMYVIENGNQDSIVDLVKEYKYNPFLIKLVNTKYEKLPKEERLVIKHPLQIIAEDTTDKNTNFNKDLLLMIKGQNYGAPVNIDKLIPKKNVPQADTWSPYKEEKKNPYGWA